MHENREISSTPWSDDQGRSAKATSRTADMYVPEKSDCAVVPVNQPNKEGQPSAEAGEGRAQTRENIAQSHMHPTPSGKRMSQGLDGVRKTAKERKQERFTALLHHLNVDLLRDSFFALQRKASPGVDGVTWQEYEFGWKIDSSICTAGFTAERIGQNLQDESLYRRLTGGNVRWASRRWKTKSCSRPW